MKKEYAIHYVLSALFGLLFTINTAQAGNIRQELLEDTGYPVGAVAQLEGTREMYIMVPVKKSALVPSVQIFQCLGLQAKKPLVLSKDEMHSLKKSPLLLRGPDGKVYEIRGEQKRHLASPAAMKRKGYDPISVLPATDIQLNCMESGPPIN